MNENKLRYIKENEISNGQFVLLIGNNSGDELRGFYDFVRKEKPASWIEQKSEDKFWLEFLKSIKGGESMYRPDLSRDQVVSYVRHLLRKEEHHLFFPDADKLFYTLDIKQKRLFGASLRGIWQEVSRNLTLLSSVNNRESLAFRKTLGTYHYPFWQNFMPLYLDE